MQEQQLRQAAGLLLQVGHQQTLEAYLQARESLGTSVNDNVHGSFSLGLLASLIVKQPELRRLESLKQLGCSSMVPAYQNATHNRLQHSRGVAHLSFKWGLIIAQQQRAEGHPPHAWLTPLDLELLELAGLCHDLGHGPFSHVFEAFIVPMLGIKGWHHETLSSLVLHHMLQRLLTELGLTQDSTQGQDSTQHSTQGQHGMQDSMQDSTKGQVSMQDSTQGGQLLQRVHGAVTDLIRGKVSTGYCGHWADKLFVMLIVASDLDADKIDYLLRDMQMAGVQERPELADVLEGLGGRVPDYVQLINNSKLVDGAICFASEDQPLVQQLYRARYLMHQHVYQHPAVKGFELAVAHVLQLTAPWLSLEWLQEFKAVTVDPVNPADPAASKRFVLRFCALRDSLLDEARRVALHNADGHPALARALAILDQFDAGETYSYVEEEDGKGCMAGHPQLCQPEAAAQAVIQALGRHSGSVFSSSSSSSAVLALQASDIRVVYCKFDHCNKDLDPLPLLWLWSEGHDGQLTKATGSWTAGDKPPVYRTHRVRVYLTKLCSTEAEEAELTAALQQALTTVLQDIAPADKVDPAAAAAAAAAKEVCDSEEGEELMLTQRLPAAAEDAGDDGAETGLPQAMDLDTTAPAAAADVCSTPTPPAAAAAAGDMYPDDDYWQQLSSQAAETSQLPCTPAPKTPGGPLPRWSSLTPCSQLGSQVAETLQQQQQQEQHRLPFGMQTEQQQEQQMMPFGVQAGQQQVLSVGQDAGEVGKLLPGSSLEPAASSYIGVAAAAAAVDVVDLTESEPAVPPGQHSHEEVVKFWQDKLGGAQKGKEANPSKRAAGSRPQVQLQTSKRPKSSNVKQH